MGLIMLDVDHFKNFNDSHGHETGDELLSALGKLLRSHSRTEDIACRYGGEEFLLILPGASTEVTARRAEELRVLVQDTLRINAAGGQQLTVTISLGVACFPEHGDSAEHVLVLADQALYQAKQAGRNRVAVSEKTS